MEKETYHSSRFVFCPVVRSRSNRRFPFLRDRTPILRGSSSSYINIMISNWSLNWPSGCFTARQHSQAISTNEPFKILFGSRLPFSCLLQHAGILWACILSLDSHWTCYMAVYKASTETFMLESTWPTAFWIWQKVTHLLTPSRHLSIIRMLIISWHRCVRYEDKSIYTQITRLQSANCLLFEQSTCNGMAAITNAQNTQPLSRSHTAPSVFSTKAQVTTSGIERISTALQQQPTAYSHDVYIANLHGQYR